MTLTDFGFWMMIAIAIGCALSVGLILRHFDRSAAREMLQSAQSEIARLRDALEESGRRSAALGNEYCRLLGEFQTYRRKHEKEARAQDSEVAR